MAIQSVKVEAFKFHVPMTERYIQTQLRMGQEKKDEGELTFLPTNDPDVELGYSVRNQEHDYFVFYRNKCVVSVAFSYAGTNEWKPFRDQFAGPIQIAEPHVVADPDFRGAGYVSFIYRMALSKRTVLMTYTHTKAASVLWERIASRTPGAQLLHWGEENTWKKSATPGTAKVLTTVPLKKKIVSKTLEVAYSISTQYVLNRMSSTLHPGSAVEPPYVSNSCHSTVCKSIKSRNHPDDKIWLYGTDRGDVMHSLLTDKNNNVVTDTFGRTGERHFFLKRGYFRGDDHMDFIATLPVSDLPLQGG